MPQYTQFDARKNSAPRSRQHGSRLAEEANSNHTPVNDTLQSQEHLGLNSQSNEPQSARHAASPHAATAGEATTNSNRLLTVHEVADLLQVPVSWVYTRTRKRSIERLPGYRLGKYWRFQREEVVAWVESQRQGSSAA